MITTSSRDRRDAPALGLWLREGRHAATVFVMGTLIFVAGLILAIVGYLMQGRKGRHEETDRLVASAALQTTFE